jgi:hypothetical protein
MKHIYTSPYICNRRQISFVEIVIKVNYYGGAGLEIRYRKNVYADKNMMKIACKKVRRSVYCTLNFPWGLLAL